MLQSFGSAEAGLDNGPFFWGGGFSNLDVSMKRVMYAATGCVIVFGWMLRPLMKRSPVRVRRQQKVCAFASPLFVLSAMSLLLIPRVRFSSVHHHQLPVVVTPRRRAPSHPSPGRLHSNVMFK